MKINRTELTNMPSSAHIELWPELPYEAWKDTSETLHLWTQIAGKIRLALTPWLNHSWHVPLYVTARGLSTSPIHPVPEGFGRYAVKPEAAFFHEGLGEFLLAYDAVRTAPDPDAALHSFLESTYEAAANLAHWERAALECSPGAPGVPRATKAA